MHRVREDDRMVGILIRLLDLDEGRLGATDADFLTIHLDGNGVAQRCHAGNPNPVPRQKPEGSQPPGPDAIAGDRDNF